MRKFWQYLLLTVTGLLLMSLSPPLIGHAKEITSVTGLDANSCVIKDAKGRVVSHTATLPAANEYSINYNWRIPNSTRIQSGDTLSFYVPDNVTVIGDRSFPMNGSGSIGVVGTTAIKDGSHVGTVTLNGRLTNSSQRSGFIRIYVKGTQPTQPVTLTKQASWTTPNDFTKITWKLGIDLQGQTVTNPQITDQLGQNHRYVSGSQSATDANGKKLRVTATSRGNQVTFKISGQVATNYSLTYQTKTTTDQGAETFSNAALYHDDNGHNASANASISRDDEPLGPDENENPGTTTPPGPTEPGTPTEPSKPNPDNPISMTKQASWVDPKDPQKINWSIVITGNGNQMVNPEVIDRLSSNQSYLPGSAKATDSNGQPITVVDSHSGTEVSFQMAGTYTGNIRLTYQSTTDEPSGAATFDNAADYHDDNGNEASATDTISREGETTEPEVPPGLTTPITMTKTAAWHDPDDFTKINWHLAVTANGNTLANPQIVDQLSDNHQYLPGTVTAKTASGQAIPVTATVSGQQLTFKLTGSFNENIGISYQTKTTSPTGAAVFNNAAIYEDDNGNNAAADASIDRDASVVEPEVPDKKVISMTKTAAWATIGDFTNILWTVTVNANGNQLVNPNFTDDISPELTYVENSVKAVDSTGQVIPVSVSANGQQLTFTLNGTFTNDLTLTYTTKTVKADGAAQYANVVIYDDDNENEASASSEIERPENPTEPETPTVTPPQPGQPESPSTTPGGTTPTTPTTPSVTQPGTNQPNVTKPNVNKPSVTKPGTNKPTVNKPSTTLTGTNKPNQTTTNSPTGGTPVSPSPALTGSMNALTTPSTTSGGSSSQLPQAVAAGILPQTNEKADQLIAIIGLLFIGLLTVIGIRQRRRKH